MSVKVQAQVWELDLPSEQQQVLLALADHAHDDGSKCHPGVDYLAWKVGKGERAIIRILKALRSTGLITPVAYISGGRGRATEYKINVSAGTRKAPFERKGVILTPFIDEAEKGVVGDRVSGLKGVVGDTLSGAKNRLKGVVSRPERVSPVVIKGVAGDTPTIRNRVTEPGSGSVHPETIETPVVDLCEREGSALARAGEVKSDVISKLTAEFAGRLSAEVVLRELAKWPVHPSGHCARWKGSIAGAMDWLDKAVERGTNGTTNSRSIGRGAGGAGAFGGDPESERNQEFGRNATKRSDRVVAARRVRLAALGIDVANIGRAGAVPPSPEPGGQRSG